ncbi:HAD family hydrolase [Rhabdochromatium marinum]|uniref:HAD family hydrolase n=1 Tax=Rhabdochromatium marinum TaxID=48729 RepID=UPI00190444D8|nr:HAD family hydrolase [Rhabdochromatium marinum]MBK1650273.1 HAD family hydrolase [Rhabdochromatium marinum]
MKHKRTVLAPWWDLISLSVVALTGLLATGVLLADDAAATPDMGLDTPLPSWNEGPAKQAITAFVEQVTTPGSADFVLPADRIATFDNDGTLWPSHPMYTQVAFALDRVKALAPQHPGWKTTEPFKSVLTGDMSGVAASGEKGLLELVMATHTGMSTAEFEKTVTDWFKTAKHPKFNRLYTELAYQPMLELLDYLREYGFTTYIVSGGGVEFMRPMTMAVYGIPSQQVIGSSVKTQYQVVNGKPELMRKPTINFIDDKQGKPVGINQFIGKRPIAAFGNSDGDREMLEWTGAGSGARLMMLVFHDDAQREYAYGPAEGLPDTKFGTFSQALMDEAKDKGWFIIRMKDDWKRIFAQSQ